MMSGRYLARLFLVFFTCGVLSVPGVGQALPSTPTGDFVDNGDGTATHLVSGLTWMRCAVGLTWTGSACSGSASTYTQAAAVSAISGLSFAGYSDWRLPTISELSGIVERESGKPTINSKVFPNTPADNFLSATPVYQSPGYAWTLNFGNGGDGSGKGGYYLRLVRGGQPVAATAASTPAADFKDNADATVTHLKTGLTWMHCSVGKKWNGSTCTGNNQYMNWSAALALTANFAGYSDWRLPSVNELKSIVEYAARSPATNAAIFPMPPNLWTSDQVSEITDYNLLGKPVQAIYGTNFAYFLNAANGTIGNTGKTLISNGALLVRGTQTKAISPPPPVRVLSLTLNCPTSLEGGASGVCNAAAAFSDFSTSTVTPLWETSDSAVLTVKGDGSFVTAEVATETPITLTATYGQGATAKNAIFTVIVKKRTLAALMLACPASLTAGTTDFCSAGAVYGNGAARMVQPLWNSSNVVALGVSPDGTLSAGIVNADTAVTVSATYGEGGITKTASTTINVKYDQGPLTGLQIVGDGSVASGGSLSLKGIASYANGFSGTVKPLWSVSDSDVVAIDENGTLTAHAVMTDTPLTVTASYSEGGVTKTAVWMITVKAAPAAFAIIHNVISAVPGGAIILSAQNGTLRSCTSDNPAVIPDPIVNTTGSVAVGSVASGAPGDALVTISCLSQSGALAQANITVTVPLGDAERVFNWAESVYPQLFAPAKPATRTEQGYVYRYYTRQNSYLAVKEGRVYYLGALTQERISDVGSLEDYLQQAKAAGY